MEENIINQIRENISEQTRNGRTKIYIRTRDLIKLGYKTDSKEERIFINVNELNNLLDDFEELER